MDVVRILWPDEQSRLDDARKRGRPRLIVVRGDDFPELTGDPLEDFVAEDAPEAAKAVRCSILAGRALREIDRVDLADGVLRFGDRRVVLSPTEFALLSAMVEREGAVVRRDLLAESVWPGEDVDRNVVDVAIGRLRRRLSGMGVSIRTVRSRGYVLELSETCQIMESEL